MSPLVSAPNRGYSDWQRVSNFDSGVLWSDASVGVSTQVQSPVLDMSRYAYLGGLIGVGNGAAVVTVTWYADVAATVQLGFRAFSLQFTKLSPAQIRIPNLGPFAQVVISSIGGPPFNNHATIIGTNRYHPLEFIPPNPYLIRQQASPIGAGASVTVTPQQYYSGPMMVWFEPGNAGMTATLENLQPDANVDLIAQIIAASVNQTIVTTWIAPPGSWFIQVNNPGGATTYYLTATPSLTGSD